MRTACGLLACAVLAAAAHAATEATAPAADPLELARPALKVYTDRDGLPENSIFDIEVDARGYLWAATENGAAYYDGRRWQPLLGEGGAGSGFVRDILAARDGSLWLAMDQKGLYRLQGGRWTHFDAQSGLPSDTVFELQEHVDRSGQTVIWAGTRDGLVRIAGDRWTTYGAAAGLADPRVTAVLPAGDDGALWVGTMSGVARFTGERFDDTLAEQPGAPQGQVRDLLQTTTGDGGVVLWVALDNQGLMRWQDGAWHDVPVAHPRLTSLLATGEGAQRTIWIGTYGRGLIRLRDGHTSLLDAQWGLPTETIRSLKETVSPEGIRALWIGTQGGGLVKMSLQGWRALDHRLGLPSDTVGPITETREKDGSIALWIGTNRGLARLLGDRLETFDRADGFPSEDINSLHAVRGPGGADELWVGMVGAIARRDEEGRWTFWGEADGIPRQTVTAVSVEPDGTVVAGTYGSGIAVLKDGVWTLHDVTSGQLNQSTWIVGTSGPQGQRTLWVATNRDGVARYDHGVLAPPSPLPPAPNSSLLCLLLTPGPFGGSRLWAGSRGGGGPFYLDVDRPGAAWVDVAAETDAPLPNSIITLVEDTAHRLYAFTTKGVARLSPRTPTATNPARWSMRMFRTYDGLPSDRCNYYGSFVDHAGRIWAGTMGGAAVLDPAEEIEDVTPKPLYVERAVYGGGQVLSPGGELPHDHGRLRFELALLSTHREIETRFRTEVVGFDPGPSEWTVDASRELTNMPGGRYVFRAWGRDWAGNVSGPLELPFVVRPAPWNWWGAWLLYAALGIGAVGLLVRHRTQVLRRETEVLESRVEARTAELKASEERALQASQAKGAFLAKMSHELRTPLNAILGFTQIMAREPGRSERDRERLGTLNRSGEHLLGLINDVLSLARIESGRVELNRSPFDLAGTVEQVAAMFAQRAEAKGLTLHVERPPTLPRFVEGDEGKLRQVLVNLVGNAIKFTERGAVTIAVEWTAGQGRFRVVDTGPGISAEDSALVFEAFGQASAGRGRADGAGLGLAISAAFVGLMGGAIEVGSELGVGSRFSFAIPLPETGLVAPTRETRQVIGVSPTDPRWRALVVDDIEENRRVLAELLGSVDIEVRTAADGPAALAAWEQWQPHVVFMDVVMSGMDGVAVTRELRRREALAGDQRALVVAVSASAFESDRQPILEAGADEFLPKPVAESALWDVLARRLGVCFIVATPLAPPVASPATNGGPGPAFTGAFTREQHRELADAVTRGDLTAAAATVATLAPSNPQLASALQARIDAFDLDGLQRAIDALAVEEPGSLPSPEGS